MIRDPLAEARKPPRDCAQPGAAIVSANTSAATDTPMEPALPIRLTLPVAYHHAPCRSIVLKAGGLASTTTPDILAPADHAGVSRHRASKSGCWRGAG